MQRTVFLCLVFAAACAVRGAAEPPPPVAVLTPLVTDAVPEEPVPPPLVQPVAFEAAEAPCERCLYVEPAQPKPGDLVMFETQAVAGLTSAMLSVYGRDVRMFRVGDRFRAFVGVPLTGDKKTYATRLWFSGSAEPDGRAFSCMEHVVRDRAGVLSENLRVARRFTAKRSLHEAASVDPNTTWVEPLDKDPFSQTLFLWPRPGEVRSGFAVSRVYNKRMQSRHMGLDIAGSVGDRAFATQAGVVRYSGRLRSTGNTVVIDHGGGILSFYMHLSQRLKNVGQKVKQSELIGYVGRTGRVTGPHLHFAVSVHGRFVDPESVLAHPLVASTIGLPCTPDPSTHSVR